MAAARVFTDLMFWQKARFWSKSIFEQTQGTAFRQDRRLVEQINDSSESVMANIAEGFGRGTQGEFVQFLGYSLGSLNETQSHLCSAYDRGFITKTEFARLFKDGTEIRKMTVAFLKSMVLHGSGVKHQRPYRSWTDQVWESYERLTGNKRPPLFETETSKASSAKPPIDDFPPV
ncbi:MAG: four helix bundle protein [Planctomycetaceae bacterium]|nr:four helix bundle protein [Planctomycetaceae bacterium]